MEVSPEGMSPQPLTQNYQSTLKKSRMLILRIRLILLRPAIEACANPRTMPSYALPLCWQYGMAPESLGWPWQSFAL